MLSKLVQSRSSAYPSSVKKQVEKEIRGLGIRVRFFLRLNGGVPDFP